MDTNATLDIMQQAIATSVKLAGPLLLISMAVGLIISILQAATQVHEQTLTFVPKLFLIALILLLGGQWMMQTLMDFFYMVFELMVE